MSHEDFMRLALEQAKLAKAGGDLPFGAVVVQGDKVVGKGRAENNTVEEFRRASELSEGVGGKTINQNLTT